jgi:hypothetical protein
MADKRCPPGRVQELMDLANSVPPQVQLPVPGKEDEVLDMFRPGGELSNFIVIWLEQRWRKIEQHALANSGSQGLEWFRQHRIKLEKKPLRQRMLQQELKAALLPAYEELYITRELLRAIAQNRSALISSRLFYLNHEVDDHGRLQFQQDNIVAAITADLKGVEGKRFRLCKVCGRIVWSRREGENRTDACQPRCAGTVRSRRHRQLYPEEYRKSAP